MGLAAGQSFGDIGPFVGDEIVIGLVYAAIGFALLPTSSPRAVTAQPSSSPR